MAVEKWIAGSLNGDLLWHAANTSSTLFNTLANGNAIMSDLAIDNSSALDMFGDFSFLAGGTATTAAPNYLGLFLYPLGEDGSTYGDGRYGPIGGPTAAAGPPPQNYWAQNAGFAAAASTTVACVWRRIELPPGKFVPVIYNQSGASLASTNIFKYRSYNRSVA